MRKQVNQIGILGGTFNPIHNGHLALARCACEQYGLQRIFFIPTGHTAYKEYSGKEMAVHRSRMVTLAIESDSRFQISFVELENNTVNYTYHTLKKVERQLPDATLYFIMGGDSLRDLETWREPQKICDLAVILAAPREDMNSVELNRQINELSKRYQADIRPLDLPVMDISSQDIRRRVQNGDPICDMVPPAVEAYILENGLYR
ncbi:MAG: nicotinate-nucleotide adenylyltransferase [Lachnospiraceae bacterium]|nr:nicotinate-nucleotide adenylyltransferase [Lachnospiraceae bacterium]